MSRCSCSSFLFLFCLAVDQEDLVRAFLLDLLALLLAVEIGALVLGQPIEELHELAEELDGGGGRSAGRFLPAFCLHVFSKLQPVLGIFVLGLELLLGLVCLRLSVHLIQPSPFLIHIDLIILIGFPHPVIPQQLQNDHIIFLDPLPDPKPMTVEAVHPEYLQQHVDDQRIVGGYYKFDMAWVAGAFEALMPAGRANGIPLVGRHSEQRIVKSAPDGLLVGIVNLRLIDLADAEPPQFLGEDKPELDLGDLIPLSHGMDVVLHDC